MSPFRSRSIKLLIIPIAIIAVIAINYSGKWKWKKQEAELRAKGEKLELTEFAPPPLPDSENFFTAPVWQKINSADNDNPPANSMRAAMRNKDGNSVLSALRKNCKEKLKLDWEVAADFYKKSGKVPANLPAPEAVLQALRSADPELEELQQAAKRPSQQSNFAYGINNKFAINIEASTRLMSVAQYLLLRSSVEAELGQSDAALDHLLLIFRLADAAKGDSLLISFLIRVSILQIAVDTIANGLSLHVWNAAQLEKIETALNAVNLPQDYAETLRVERAYGGSLIDYAVEQGDLARTFQGVHGSDEVKSSDKQDFAIKIQTIGYKILSFHKSKANHFQLIQKLIEDAEAPNFSAKSSFELTKGTKFSPFDLFSMTLPTIAASKERVAHCENALRQAKIACELESYRLENNTYPESLNILNQKLPADIYSEKAMRYERLSPSEYKLWSIGPDEIDQEGEIQLNRETKQGDIIWFSDRAGNDS